MACSDIFLISCVLCCLFSGRWCESKEPDLLLLTVATEANDGFMRFMRTANDYKYNLQVLGMGQDWKGGDIQRFPGGGQKILLMREALEPLKDRKDLVVLFTDSYDVVITGSPFDVLKTFKKFGANIVFSAEGFCWPDPSLAEKYPEVKMNEYRFLNSGGFIGYAPSIYALLHHGDVQNEDDDQLYYSKIFVDKTLRSELSMKLDTRSEIFQNLNGALDDVQVKFKGNTAFLYNHRTGNTPAIIHGNGPIKHKLNNLANYLADQWTPTTGCQKCSENSVSLNGVKEEDLPTIFMALFLNEPVPFVEEFFNYIDQLEYPKDKITLFIHYSDDYHTKDVLTFMDNNGLKFRKVQVFNPNHGLGNGGAHNRAIDECVARPLDCQYFFSVDSDSHLEDKHVLVDLIERNRSVVAPLMSRPGKSWSNFWGALNDDGFYKRSDDYIQILERQHIGLWNVPYLTGTYLVHGYLAPKLVGAYQDEDMDADMAFCKTLRNLGIFMYVDNNKYYGHLVSNADFPRIHHHNDLYQLVENKYTWDKKYLHEDYAKSRQDESIVEQPCPDVFWYPLFSPTFCTHLIEEMENLNQWSNGKNDDPRLAGGYENVPTVDTHMNQIGFEKHWLQIIRDYIAPLSLKAFQGYYTDARALMNFVVRYRPDEQDRLRPHSDSSTFTVNIALNRPHLDYEGGGVRFLRYNCTVTNLRLGWSLMHPGRLTHHHEGLPTTAGTRYIMVSFIDP